jgi:hypothetical protein
MAGNIKIVTVNTTDKVGCLSPRDAFFGRTLIGSNWLEVRYGMFFTFVPSGNDDAACGAESIVQAGYLDWFTFGLKNSDNAEPPGKFGAQFLGHAWPGGAGTLAITANSAGGGAMTSSANTQLLAALNGVTKISSADSHSQGYPIWAAGNVNAFMGVKLTVQNFGLANQTVTPSHCRVETAATDVSSAALRNALFNTSYNAVAALNWFSGGAALPLPDALWLRAPFNNNRVRITNIDCFKIA